MGRLLLLALFLSAPCLIMAAEVSSPGVRILQGSLVSGQTVTLAFVGDQDDFGDASLPVHGVADRRITAADVMADLGPALREQAVVYARAQLAGGTRENALLPLHVVLDPAGTWAYAHSVARFRYRYRGRDVGPLSCPVLVMGMDATYAKPQGSKNEATEARNRKMLELLGPWYAATIGSSKGGQKDLEKTLGRWTLTMDDGSKRTVVEAVGHASCRHYLGWLERIVVADLSGRKLDGEALWANCPHRPALDALVLENQLVGVRRRIAETVSHELGHLIHFTAAGPNHVNLGGHAPHMNGTSHQRTTLSNEEFAFVEGWAEANAFVVTRDGEGAADGANRIDYADTVEVVRKKLNEAFGRAVSAAVHTRGFLAPSTPFTVPPWESDHESFMAGIRSKALELGMSEGSYDALVKETSQDDEVAHLLRAHRYVNALQARKGELKSRYDFLRSEASVAHVLTQLRLRLGQEVNVQVLDVLAREQSRGGKPDTLAELLESYVHAHPEKRLEIYRLLAEITEGILVTPAEATLLAQLAQGGMDLEIDLDRDGWVPGGPGANANLLQPGLFRPEEAPLEGWEDPLSFSGKRNETLVPMAAAISFEERQQGETPMADAVAPAEGRWARSADGRFLFPAEAPPVEDEDEGGEDDAPPLWDDLNRF